MKTNLLLGLALLLVSATAQANINVGEYQNYKARNLLNKRGLHAL